ncbi:MAG: hypothetical protein GXY36_20190 [Chloroflexi bacterium]|nr:hypothetical protein [Chloroflexota bacterium]
MSKIHIASYDKDLRSTDELIKAALDDLESDTAQRAIGVLHYRGSEEVFEAAQGLCASERPLERELGVRILGTLGWDTPTFVDESVQILIERLQDQDEEVIAAAAKSLGDRNHPKAIPYLLKLIDHPNPSIRSGVVWGLSGHDNEMAIKGLIILSQDEDDDIRNWATFGLGDLTEVNIPELRAALIDRLNDNIPEVRGEALLGLARRKDERVIQPIIRELEGKFEGIWALEAAAILANPILYPYLLTLREHLPENIGKNSLESLNAAIDACKPSNL